MVGSFPLLLFANQVVNASIKVFLTFRLSRQRWANRGSQTSPQGDLGLHRFRSAMATFLTVLFVAAFVLIVSARLGVIDLVL